MTLYGFAVLLCNGSAEAAGRFVKRPYRAGCGMSGDRKDRPYGVRRSSLRYASAVCERAAKAAHPRSPSSSQPQSRFAWLYGCRIWTRGTDCHTAFALAKCRRRSLVRNDRTGCGTAGDRKGRPYEAGCKSPGRRGRRPLQGELRDGGRFVKRNYGASLVF